jgi:hypothetical protein
MLSRISTISLIPTRSRSGRRSDAKTGPKFGEELNWKSLGHDVRELVRGRDMKNPKLSQCHLLTDEVNVDLDMLRAPMVNWIFRHVDGTHIVTEDNRGVGEGNVEFL